MRVIVYGRLNHTDAAAMLSQINMLKRYCGKEGYVISSVVTEFSSGRKIGQCLIGLLDNNNSRMDGVDAIVVRNFSCITKNYMNLLGFMEALEEKKIRIISLDEEVVEPASALWKLICKNIK